MMDVSGSRNEDSKMPEKGGKMIKKETYLAIYSILIGY